jgi:hypothetical protein
MIMVSSRSQMKTRSVLDSGVVGETVFVRLPLPRVPLCSGPRADGSRDLRALSAFKGEVEPSARAMPFDGLSKSHNSNWVSWGWAANTVFRV